MKTAIKFEKTALWTAIDVFCLTNKKCYADAFIIDDIDTLMILLLYI